MDIHMLNHGLGWKCQNLQPDDVTLAGSEIRKMEEDPQKKGSALVVFVIILVCS